MADTIVFIVGPTASGKTKLSVAVAQHFNGEIVSADSMQVYRGLDIGTAKISDSAADPISHHMISVVDPRKEYSVYDFRVHALACIKAIHARGNMPFVVGGSGLYIKALLDGLAPQPGQDRAVRARLQGLASEQGTALLHTRLSELDPHTAAGINPQDERRIIRALEICELSQKTPSEWKQETVSLMDLGYQPIVIGIDRDRSTLYERVHERVDEMLAQGLLDEVRALKDVQLSRTTKQAVGYKELFDFLDGQCAFEDAVATIKKNTRHLVKKQLTWFRKEKRIEWFPVEQYACEQDMVVDLIKYISEHSNI